MKSTDWAGLKNTTRVLNLANDYFRKHLRWTNGGSGWNRRGQGWIRHTFIYCFHSNDYFYPHTITFVEAHFIHSIHFIYFYCTLAIPGPLKLWTERTFLHLLKHRVTNLSISWFKICGQKKKITSFLMNETLSFHLVAMARSTPMLQKC